MKKILAMIVSICLIMSLAIPVFATGETSGTTAQTTTASTGENTTADTSEAASTPSESVDASATGDEVVADGEAEHDHEHEEEEDSAFVKVLRIVLIVLEVIASIALIVVVLLQSGKEAGLSSAISGNSDSYLSKSGRQNLDKALAKATKWVVLVWVILTLALSLI